MKRISLFIVCMILVASQARAESMAMWLDMGLADYGSDGPGGKLAINLMPHEQWGVSARAVAISDGTGFMDDILNPFMELATLGFYESSNTPARTLHERALLVRREFYDGQFAVALGAGVARERWSVLNTEQEATGIAYSVALRTKRWDGFGVSLSLDGNVNDVASFHGINFNFELGQRYR